MYSNFKVKIFVDVFLMRLNLYFDELVKCNNIKFLCTMLNIFILMTLAAPRERKEKLNGAISVCGFLRAT